MDKEGYPTKGELYNISNWRVVTKESLLDLINYVRERWKYVHMGYFKLSGKNVIQLELHTAGWSGNESVLGALERNKLFWIMGWKKSTVGGHFWFKFDLKQFRTEEEYSYATEGESVHIDRVDDSSSDNRDTDSSSGPEVPDADKPGPSKKEGDII